MTTSSPTPSAESRRLATVRFYAEPAIALRLISRICQLLQKAGVFDGATWEYENERKASELGGASTGPSFAGSGVGDHQ